MTDKQQVEPEDVLETVHDLLSLLQRKLKVPKNQRNTFGNYNYRNCEDILEAVKKALPQGSYVKVTDVIELIGDRFYVKSTASINWYDSSIENVAYAREALTKKGMDESQVTGATSSYARKYALNGLFAIDDTKDADSKDNSEESQPKAKKDDQVRGGTTSNELAEDWPLEARKSTVKEVLNRLNGLTKEKEKEAKTYTNKIIKNLKFVGSNDLALELEVALEHAINALNPNFEDDDIGF